MVSADISYSLLRESLSRFSREPFVDETRRLFTAICDGDLDALLGMTDEDFSTIEVDPDDPTHARVSHEWEPWFRRFFDVLAALGASTDTEVTSYQGIGTAELGYSVIEFRQDIVGPFFIASFDCVATIVWKPTEDGWKEARWHCSVNDSRFMLPELDGHDLDRQQTAVA
ncbi:MAG: nuclear transport factor 2 family protein [Acidobacteriota bacterium]